MFSTSPATLRKSLYKLLDCAQDYVADVCFDFPNGKIWAHRAILLARVPKGFRQQYLSELDVDPTRLGQPLTMDKPVLPYSVFVALLRFWYTAEFGCLEHQTNAANEADTGVSISSLSITSTQSNPTPTITESLVQRDTATGHNVYEEIRMHETQLGTALLPICVPDTTDLEQLANDLDSLWQTGLGSDTTVHLLSESQAESTPVASFSCHRCILVNRSAYFDRALKAESTESSRSTVYLTNERMSPISLHIILRYFYTDKLIVPDLPPEEEEETPATDAQKLLRDKTHALRAFYRVFQDMNYLDLNDDLRTSIVHEMATVCHEFICVCSDCALLLPFMLNFADTHANVMDSIRDTLITQYSEVSSPTLWASRTFAAFIQARPDLVREIVSRTLANANKHTAIHVIPLAHGCLSHIDNADPAQTWSQPTLAVLNLIVRHCVTVVADNFEFYCGIYPVLLSCVDGIKGEFSLDSIGFLLKKVLEEGINEKNAGSLYRGIARHLLGRHGIDRSSEVYTVLASARQECVQYLAAHWPAVKAQGGFRGLDKDTLRELSEDLNVPYRSLTKRTFDSDFASLFRFRPKSQVTPKKPRPLSGLSYHRLSFRSLRGLSHETTLTPDVVAEGRLSADISLHPGHAPSFSPHLTGDTKNPVSGELGSSNHLTSLGSSKSSASAMFLDDLLPLDMWRSCYPVSASPSPHAARQVPSPRLPTIAPVSKAADATTPPTDTPIITAPSRPQRITFELPVTPQRVSAPPAKHPAPSNRLKRNRSPLSYYRLMLTHSNSSSSSDGSDSEDAKLPVIGAKVELLRRPLPTLGTIKFVGPVQFAKGTWVGVELESRLGNNDGAIDGVRYFHTNPQRGAFCKLDDFKIVSLPRKGH